MTPLDGLKTETSGYGSKHEESGSRAWAVTCGIHEFNIRRGIRRANAALALLRHRPCECRSAVMCEPE
jgi:hypothetical protein